MLSNCVILQEKERLGQEWRRLEEQRTLFERERRKFTEAAIRLGEEVILALHVNEFEVTFETISQHLTQLTLAVARLYRGRPLRRTGPCGSKTSF